MLVAVGKTVVGEDNPDGASTWRIQKISFSVACVQVLVAISKTGLGKTMEMTQYLAGLGEKSTTLRHTLKPKP